MSNCINPLRQAELLKAAAITCAAIAVVAAIVAAVAFAVIFIPGLVILGLTAGTTATLIALFATPTALGALALSIALLIKRCNLLKSLSTETQPLLPPSVKPLSVPPPPPSSSPMPPPPAPAPQVTTPLVRAQVQVAQEQTHQAQRNSAQKAAHQKECQDLLNQCNFLPQDDRSDLENALNNAVTEDPTTKTPFIAEIQRRTKAAHQNLCNEQLHKLCKDHLLSEQTAKRLFQEIPTIVTHEISTLVTFSDKICMDLATRSTEIEQEIADTKQKITSAQTAIERYQKQLKDIRLQQILFILGSLPRDPATSSDQIKTCLGSISKESILQKLRREFDPCPQLKAIEEFLQKDPLEMSVNEAEGLIVALWTKTVSSARSMITGSSLEHAFGLRSPEDAKGNIVIARAAIESYFSQQMNQLAVESQKNRDAFQQSTQRTNELAPLPAKIETQIKKLRQQCESSRSQAAPSPITPSISLPPSPPVVPTATTTLNATTTTTTTTTTISTTITATSTVVSVSAPLAPTPPQIAGTINIEPDGKILFSIADSSLQASIANKLEQLLKRYFANELATKERADAIAHLLFNGITVDQENGRKTYPFQLIPHVYEDDEIEEVGDKPEATTKEKMKLPAGISVLGEKSWAVLKNALLQADVRTKEQTIKAIVDDLRNLLKSDKPAQQAIMECGKFLQEFKLGKLFGLFEISGITTGPKIWAVKKYIATTVGDLFAKLSNPKNKKATQRKPDYLGLVYSDPGKLGKQVNDLIHNLRQRLNIESNGKDVLKAIDAIYDLLGAFEKLQYTGTVFTTTEFNIEAVDPFCNKLTELLTLLCGLAGNSEDKALQQLINDLLKTIGETLVAKESDLKDAIQNPNKDLRMGQLMDIALSPLEKLANDMGFSLVRRMGEEELLAYNEKIIKDSRI